MLALDWRRYVKQTQELYPEYKRLVSNPALMYTLHWQPNIELQELAEMMIYTQ